MTDHETDANLVAQVVEAIKAVPEYQTRYDKMRGDGLPHEVIVIEQDADEITVVGAFSTERKAAVAAARMLMEAEARAAIAVVKNHFAEAGR